MVYGTFIPYVLLGLAGFAATTRNYTQMVPIELQALHWTGLIQCMGDLSSLYDISVSETGWVNIGPIENRDPDLNGTDARLLECLTATQNNRLLASIGHNGAESEDAGPVPIDEVTYEWLIAEGAMGQEPRPMSGDQMLENLVKRASQYTVRVSASAKDCTATTAYTPYTESCQTKSTNRLLQVSQSTQPGLLRDINYSGLSSL